MTDLRRTLKASGFPPIPVIGKRPPMDGWDTKIDANDQEIDLWDKVWPEADNTGIFCKFVPVIDIDILNPDAAEAVEQLVRDRYEEAGSILVRIGLAPKRAIPFRTNDPFKKITRNLIAPDGDTKQKLELLCDGQQFVAFGIHPDTSKPYAWRGGWPGETKREELPYLHAEQAADLVQAAVELLCREHGYRPAEQRPRAKANGNGAEGAGAEDWGYLTCNILNGHELHDSLRDLSAKLVASGMSKGAVVNYLYGLMDRSSIEHDARWQVRRVDIPRLVDGLDNKPEKPVATLMVWDAGTVVDKPPPRQWLLGNSFCRNLVSSLLGDGGVGKSALRTLQALALATGRQLTGEHVFKRTRVLLVSLEDDDKELNRRVLAARLHYNIERADVAGWLFLSAPGKKAGKLATANAKTGTVTAGEMATLIEAEVRQHDIGLVILDPYIKAHSVPENDNALMDEVAGLLTEMGARLKIGIDTPHHISKGAADPGNASRGRGASATVNAARLVYTLGAMSSDEAKLFSVAEQDRRGFVRLDRAKLNAARSTGAATWFKLIGVRLDNGNETYPQGDEVQTVELWQPPSTWGDTTTGGLNAILNDIARGMGNGQRYSNTPNTPEDRQAWRVVQKRYPDKPEAQCRAIIHAWIESGLLLPDKYVDPMQRKERSYLRVDSTKRPDGPPGA